MQQMAQYLFAANEHRLHVFWIVQLTGFRH